jgi:hypothetical protein
VIIEAEIDQIKGQIEENLKFGGQLRVQLHKLEARTKMNMTLNFWADD